MHKEVYALAGREITSKPYKNPLLLTGKNGAFHKKTGTNT